MSGYLQRLGLRLMLGALIAVSSYACSGPPKPKPKPLVEVAPQLTDHQVWKAHVGTMLPGMRAAVSADQVVVPSKKGTVKAFHPETGALVWQADAKVELSAGAGSDGRYVAVVSQNNELMVFDRAQLLWREVLPTKVVTAPLVAGERVFIQGVDRSVSAFDVLDGRRLWVTQRPGDPLTLAQPGVLLPGPDVLFVGVGARLVVLDPLTGALRREWTLATPRGANEVERLADLVGPAVILPDQMCARAYQAAVACVSLASGQLTWTQTAGGYYGLAAYKDALVGADASDRLTAWRVKDGSVLWSSEALLHHGLGPAASTDAAIVLGDKAGRLHFISPQDGQFLLRLKTDGSPITVPPQRQGVTLIVTTQKGGVFAFRPR